jgi:hypothetical protein
VEEEEAGEAEVADRRQLPLQPRLRFGPKRRARVALSQLRLAHPGQLAVGGRVFGARVAIAQLLCQVEVEAFAEAQGLGDRLGVLGEAARHRLRRGQRRGRVAAPPRLARLQRRPQPHRDEGVLEAGAAAAWEWTLPVATQGTPSRSARPASQRLRARSWRHQGRCSSTRKRSRPKAASRRRADAAAPAASRSQARRRPRRGRSRRGRPALGVLFKLLERHGRLPGGAAGAVAGVRMSFGQQPAEVAVADRAFDQESQVSSSWPRRQPSTQSR